jgi:hypothetical protein
MYMLQIYEKYKTTIRYDVSDFVMDPWLTAN